VEKDFHIEISTCQGEERTGVVARSSSKLELQQQGHIVWSLSYSGCVCMQVSMETDVYTRVHLRKGMYISNSVKVRGCAADEELLVFAGVV
jgi:hypothetical protein